KYTFGTLLRKLPIPREPGRIPLVPVVFNIDMNMDDGVSFEGLRHRFVSNPRRHENFELFLNATGNSERLVLEWSYNTDLFDQSTIENWHTEFTSLIRAIIADPHQTMEHVLELAVGAGTLELPPQEWLGRAVAYPREKSIGQLWDEQVKL